MASLLNTLFSCLIIIHMLPTCFGKKTHHCSPSSCGNIPNISHPFRLKTDPKNCGNPVYELACENNTAFMYLDSSHKYIVRAINYPNYTIHLADPSISLNDSCSLPNYSVSTDKFRDDYPYSITRYRNTQRRYRFRRGRRDYITSYLSFMRCPYPVNNALLLEVTGDCGHRSYGFNKSDSKQTYIKYGELNGSYIMDNCTIDLIVLMTPLPLKAAENSVSLSEIHSALLYGFELSWFNALCDKKCTRGCFFDGKRARCDNWCYVVGWAFRCGRLPLWFVDAFNYIFEVLQLRLGDDEARCG